MVYSGMVKTTIILDDELYKELVNESIAEYGSTRKLSLLINRKLRSDRAKTPGKKPKIRPIRLGRRITEKEIAEAIEAGWDGAIR